MKAADAPKSYADLLDPKWKNQVAVGHPSYSGYVGTWVVAMRKLYGWDFFEKLEKNQPQNEELGRFRSETEKLIGVSPAPTSRRAAHL